MQKPSEDSAELAFRRLDGLWDELRAGPDVLANEAKIRLAYIDRVLFEVLRWSHVDVDPEKHCRPGFADYACSVGGKVRMVIEAKRSGETFLINGSFRKGPVPYGLLSSESKVLREAVQQSAEYASQLGATVAVASNGYQWVVVLAYVPGEPLHDRNVTVFESVDAIRARFREFYDLLSPLGIRTNAAVSILMTHVGGAPPPKASTTIVGYPVVARRNELRNELGHVLDAVWIETGRKEGETEFLRACYVLPSDSEGTMDFAFELVSQRLGLDGTAIDVITPGDNISGIDLVGREKPILVLGQVGHGKTTFLRYLKLVRAPEEMSRYVQIDIDFVDEPAHEQEVTTFIYRMVERQLIDVYNIDPTDADVARGALQGSLARLHKTARWQCLGTPEERRREEARHIDRVVGDRKTYFPKLFAHVKKGQGRSVAVFFDNLDRRNPRIQEEAFLRASAIAREWDCLVFVCLRPDTFANSRKGGVLDSLSPTTISIVAPDIGLLLKRRFRFAAEVARGERGPELSFRAAPTRGATFDLPAAAKVLDTCGESFARNSKLGDLFVAAANGNMRELLEHVKRALVSRHLNTHTILDRSGKYGLREHDMLRALLFGSYQYYSGSDSIFCNLFDILSNDSREHFIRLSILRRLMNVTDRRGPSRFVPEQAVLDDVCSLGFALSTATDYLRDIEERGCVECWPGQVGANEARRIAVTELGRYQAHALLGKFAYYDAIAMDTPISDDAVLRAIRDSGSRPSLEHAVSRVRLLVGYLSECVADYPDRVVRELWRDMSHEVEQEAAAVETAIGSV